MAEGKPKHGKSRLRLGAVRKRLGLYVLLVALVYGSAAVFGIPPWYTFTAVEGRVVDAETGRSLEGVIVVANWEYESGSLGGGNVSQGKIKLAETVTDTDGRFRLEGFSRPNFMLKEVRESSPQLIIYRPGYWYVMEYNGGSGGPFRRSRFKGGEIRLTKIVPAEGNIYQLGLGGYVRHMMGRCNWTKMPKLIQAMEIEKKWFAQEHPLAFTDLIGISDITDRSECSPERFFLEYRQ